MRGWLLCGMLLLSTPRLAAEPLRVDALRLDTDAAWRRGDAVQEQEDDAYLLEWRLPAGAVDAAGNVPPGQVALQVALPRRATPLKSTAEDFYANLRKKWAAQYGKRAAIGEIEIAGRPWLACRRPASDGSARVFQFATVHEGRAYALIAFAAPQAEGLPKPVHDLLQGVGFGQDARAWIAIRSITARPGHEALHALMQWDVDRLGAQGQLTGYGVDYRQTEDATALGVNWFIEGYRWQAGSAGDVRVPLQVRGQLDAGVPVRAADALAVTIRLAAEAATGAEVEISKIDLCAEPRQIEEALAALAHGAHKPLERLAQARPVDCPAADNPPVRRVAVEPGRIVTEIVTFPLPPAPAATKPPRQIRVLRIRPSLAGEDEALGQPLLRSTGLYFVLAPE